MLLSARLGRQLGKADEGMRCPDHPPGCPRFLVVWRYDWFGAPRLELGAFAWVGQPDPGGRTLWACDMIPPPQNGWVGQNGMGCAMKPPEGHQPATNSLLKHERKAAYSVVQAEFTKESPRFRCSTALNYACAAG